MAFMGNMTTANASEINPNNFAARPGMIANNAPKPEHDYLFGANMGHTHLENNLNISKSVIRTRLPVTFPKLGSSNNTNQAEYRTMLKEVHPVEMERKTILDVARENPVHTLLLLLFLTYPAEKITKRLLR